MNYSRRLGQVAVAGLVMALGIGMGPLGAHVQAARSAAITGIHGAHACPAGVQRGTVLISRVKKGAAVVEMASSPTDNNAHLFRNGTRSKPTPSKTTPIGAGNSLTVRVRVTTVTRANIGLICRSPGACNC